MEGRALIVALAPVRFFGVGQGDNIRKGVQFAILCAFLWFVTQA